MILLKDLLVNFIRIYQKLLQKGLLFIHKTIKASNFTYSNHIIYKNNNRSFKRNSICFSCCWYFLSYNHHQEKRNSLVISKLSNSSYRQMIECSDLFMERIYTTAFTKIYVSLLNLCSLVSFQERTRFNTALTIKMHTLVFMSISKMLKSVYFDSFC